jgi:hypothetical protein
MKGLAQALAYWAAGAGKGIYFKGSISRASFAPRDFFMRGSFSYILFVSRLTKVLLFFIKITLDKRFSLGSI